MKPFLKQSLLIAILFVVFIICSSNEPADQNANSHQNNITYYSKHVPGGFVDLSLEIPGIILDIKYASRNNFMGTVVDGYYAPRAFLLPEAANALRKAQVRFSKIGLRIKVFDTYRPLRAVRHMVKWAGKTKNGESLLKQGYISSRVDKNRKFGHPCGNTIDLTLVDIRGTELDMGTGFDEFSCNSWTMNARGLSLKNRLLLKKIMESEGFVNYSKEWWHYSYNKASGPARDEPIR